MIYRMGYISIRTAADPSQGSTDSTIIGQVYKDDKVQIVGRNGAWYQVITESGLEGYVSATYVEVTEEL